MSINWKEELAFYHAHLHEVILPFWLERAIDEEHGGYYTCFDNRGECRVSTDKYVWSQGRFVWVLSRLADRSEEKRDHYLDLAAQGVDFLREHAILENGNCAFLLTEDGIPKEQNPGEGYDTSFYVDCFVVIGLSEYARVSGDLEVLELALSMYESIVERVENDNIRTEPYPIPAGYRAHGVSMITLNTGQVLVDALVEQGDPRQAYVENKAESFLWDIVDNFIHDGLILEMVGTDNQPVDSILGTYVNPGHTIEDLWFILHQARRADDEELVDMVVPIAKKTFELGWDREYGGLFQYIHKDGGQPRGRTEGIEQAKMVDKLKSDWANKLWWPHSEALYTFLLTHMLTGDREIVELYSRVREYTFETFPHPDPEIGEWIQIRKRDGDPVEKVVALPVKDPFHIARNLLLIIELLETKLKCDC